MDKCFYEPCDGGYRATVWTRGPWDARAQHGGPPTALLTGLLERHHPGAQDYSLVRIDVELLRPVPLAEVQAQVVMVHDGRQAQRLEATLSAGGKLCMRVRGLRMRRLELEVGAGPGIAVWPEPESLAPYDFSFFPWEEGYHRAISLRIAHGGWGRTPIGVWATVDARIVSGRPTSPWEQLVCLADAQSGMGVPLEPGRWTFVNPDLSVWAIRPPEGRWVGFDIRSEAAPTGAGIAESALRDHRGFLGRSAQTLLVRPR